MESQVNYLHKGPLDNFGQNRVKWILLITGIVLLLVLATIGTIVVCISYNNPSDQSEMCYSQSLIVEPTITSNVDYNWIYDEDYPDMNFILEIQATPNPQTEPTDLDWTTPVITKTLSNSDYTANGNTYSYTLIDTGNVLIYGTGYWSRIQMSSYISSAWDYSTAYFLIQGSCATASDCNTLSGTANTLYKTDPISQAVYYGFCRYADDISQCMEDVSSRYTTGSEFGIFSPNVLPGASCYPVSPSDPMTVCAPPLPPFAARVQSSDKKTNYASCVSPYNINSKYAYNSSDIKQVNFSDWTSNTNAYTNGFIWTLGVTDSPNITCVVPIRTNTYSNQSEATFLQRYAVSGHPYLIWNTRYSYSDGTNQTPFKLNKGDEGDGYPMFRLYHPGTRSLITNQSVHAPNSGHCANELLELYRADEGSAFHCVAQGHGTDDEKCYLFSMWNTCGGIDDDTNGVNITKTGDPLSYCYSVWNMPVQNGEDRQMLVGTPSNTTGQNNPDTCEEVSIAQEYFAMGVSGTTAGDPTYNFDFYQNAYPNGNLQWPPTPTTSPWVQPIQYCASMSSGSSEYYESCHMYMYTFADTDSNNPASYTTVGWYNLSGLTNSQSTYTTTQPTGDQSVSGNTLVTKYVGPNNYTMYYQVAGLGEYFFGIGSQYTDYTNTDGKANVYSATLTQDYPPPTINITESGLLRTTKDSMTYYLCSYANEESTQNLLWINLQGNYKFDNSITIRCPMFAVYYTK